MLSAAFLLLVSNGVLALRLGDGVQGTFPKPLKDHEEREYVDKWILEEDTNARNILIEHNLRLVAHIVKKYYSQSSDNDDLISIGTIGLIKGVSSYRPDKNVRLATYCSRCIENEILMHFRSLKKSSGDFSLSEPIDVDGEGNSLSLMDILACEDDMLDNLSAEETRLRLLDSVRKVLDKREAEIISLRYGLWGREALTQRETAEKCGISRSYVSRIEKKAIEKLRKAMED
ncbi:MAG: RNA polymerase sporulation sigma factor SigK [Oscillospiraceae bacterium]|nr:RNA polymerase sporulation sigma factor SigK [Oscillospiraceae bacterium]